MPQDRPEETAPPDRHSPRADAAPPQPGELTIEEHDEAIALVASLQPFCARWRVDLSQPETADEVGLVMMSDGLTPGWAIYRDDDSILHFEDLAAGRSYSFETMAAGLRLVRAVLEAAAAAAADAPGPREWWQGLPAWLRAGAPGRLRA